MGLTGVAAAGAFLMSTVPAHATITGNCAGTGYSIPRSALRAGQDKPSIQDIQAGSIRAGGSTVDFKTQTTWHVPSWKDYLGGVGQADGAMKSGFAFVSFFGFNVAVAGGTGSDTRGQGGPVSAYDIARKNMPPPFKDEPPAKSLGGAGAAVPDPRGRPPASGPCSGAIIVEFDDASAVHTAIGQIGIGMMAVGAFGIAFILLLTV
jgi:hypothetical protein